VLKIQYSPKPARQPQDSPPVATTQMLFNPFEEEVKETPRPKNLNFGNFTTPKKHPLLSTPSATYISQAQANAGSLINHQKQFSGKK
jgi:hypothetical protein